MTLALMADQFWEEAVVLEAPGRILRVISCRDAAICLLNYWQGDHPTRKAALDKCQFALNGNEEPESARVSFIEAAKEAGFQINSWT
ncbi:DUF982 domain-containing protein [Rhizobium sp. RAF56]|jgi:hypothetical protein|uniref:DUF982 domain-containing protein n=1 Tax=Rhizobium sp. RAF56 TaxID=3233062 RepID=UPI003F9951DE